MFAVLGRQDFQTTAKVFVAITSSMWKKLIYGELK
jgi:hypothetical protein